MPHLYQLLYLLSNSGSVAVSHYAVDAKGVQTQKARVGGEVRLLSVSRSGVGIVKSTDETILCGEDCNNFYLLGSEVNLTASINPESGYDFDSWGGDCSGNGPCKIAMDDNRHVTATFVALPTYKLKLVSGSGGSIIHDPSVDCDYYGTCKNRHYKGTTVKLKAESNNGFYLKKWVGCMTAENDLCTAVIDKPVTTVRAVFEKLPRFKLSINKTKYGSVISNPFGLKCGPNSRKCSSRFTTGTDVTLTLKPLPGHTYTGWSGACIGVTTDTCTVKMDGPKTVGAIFQ